MNTTLTVKIDKKLRDESKKVAKEMGVPLTTAVNVLLKNLVRDRVLVLAGECPFPSHTPNAETQKAVRELRAYKAGKRSKKAKSYATADDLFDDVLGKEWRVKA